MLDYIYTHVATEATTGYFACLPAQPVTLAAALDFLVQHPHDSFLYSHVLSQICELSDGELEEWLEQLTREHGSAPVAALLLELSSRKGRGIPAGQEPGQAELPYFADPLRVLLDRKILEQNSHIASMALANVNEHILVVSDNAQAGSGLRPEELPPASNQTSGITVDPRETWRQAAEACARAGLLAGPEMRHEASLSPIALLRDWRILVEVRLGPQEYRLTGQATAYGRGLSLAQARASCIMEVVERASAYASVAEGGEYGDGWLPASGQSLRLVSMEELSAEGAEYVLPYHPHLDSGFSRIPFYWLRGERPDGVFAWVPFQAATLFANLAEPNLFQFCGSTGLGAGNTLAEARLSALVEVIERDAHATVPFDPRACFLPYFHEPRLRDLLEDYHARGIFPQFQDITSEIGVPAYRCFVQGQDGGIRQATGASLQGSRAALAALTETPWPYSWATPAPFGVPSAQPAAGLPVRYVEELPNHDQGSPEANLALLESALSRRGHRISYVDLTRADLGLPVVRAVVSGLACSSDWDNANPPHDRFLMRLPARR